MKAPAFVLEERFPKKVVNKLQECFNLRLLVETGTGSGNTSGALSRQFDKVVTIELHEKTDEAANINLARFKNVRCVYGDSAKCLPALLQNKDISNSPVFFWLDGHYSGPGTALGDTECPVVPELQAISTNCQTPFVVGIDDARFFVDIPPAPHKQSDWPRVQQLTTMFNNPERTWFQVADALFWVPVHPEFDKWLRAYEIAGGDVKWFTA